MEPKPAPAAPTQEASPTPKVLLASTSEAQTPPPSVTEAPQPTSQLPPAPHPKPAAPKSDSDSKKPLLAIVLATVVFVGLAGAAYYAYSKTK